MARNNKISLPSSGGGLIRYFDEYRSKISFKPGHIIVLVVIIIIIEVILHTWGYGFLGIQ